MIGVAHRALRGVITAAVAVLIAAAGLPSHAQTPACPDMVRQALQNTGQNCTSMGRDQLCYGYDHVDIALRADAAPGSVTFRTPGDMIDMAVVDTIRPAALDSASGTWGVAYLRTRASIADVAAGQFVTFMLFGDVELQQASTAAPDGVHAYYFRTGIGGSDDAGCQNTPANGILIQTPKGAGQVQLVMNEVRLSIGSTVFLQTTPTSLPRGLQATPTPASRATGQRPTLRVRTFEGHAIVQSGGKSELVIAGSELDVPLDDEYIADGEPGEPEVFDAEILDELDTFLEEASDGDLFEDRDPVFDEEDLADLDLTEWDTEDWNWDEWEWDDDDGDYWDDATGDETGDDSGDETGEDAVGEEGDEESDPLDDGAGDLGEEGESELPEGDE